MISFGVRGFMTIVSFGQKLELPGENTRFSIGMSVPTKTEHIFIYFQIFLFILACDTEYSAIVLPQRAEEP